MNGRSPLLPLAMLCLASASMAPPARAGTDQSLANLGRAANAGGSVGGAMQWSRQIDHLTTLLDHVQRLWRYGPYSEVSDLPVKPASTPTDGGPRNPTQPVTTPRAPPGSPGSGSTSTRACTYPAGYPRVPAPRLLPSSSNSATIHSLIIKEIASRSDAPTAADLTKWSMDAGGTRLDVVAGPVFGAYLVHLPYAMSQAQADMLIARMYFSDTRDAERGCRYDYIVPDEAGEKASFMPPQRPRVGFSTPGQTATIIATEDFAFPQSAASIGNGVVKSGWPLLGAWAHSSGALDQPPRTMAQVPIAVIDYSFLPGSSPNPLGVRYHGSVTLISRDGERDSSVDCLTPDDARAGLCHGDAVAAVLAQDVHIAHATGGDALVGGILGTNLVYLGTASDPDVGTPLLAKSDRFPIERIETGQSALAMSAAMAYAAGRPFGYRRVDGKTMLTDSMAGDVTKIAPLDPAPRLLNMSIGASYPLLPPRIPMCEQPLFHEVMQLIRSRGIVVVASAGNVGSSFDKILKQVGPFGHDAIEIVPRDCSGVIVAAGAIPTPPAAGGAPSYAKAPNSLVGHNPATFWAPYMTNIGTDVGTDRAATLQVNGTSFSAPRIAGTSAIMLSIEPDLKPQQIAQILGKTSLAIPGAPPMAFVRPEQAWLMVMERQQAKLGAQPSSLSTGK